LPSYEDVENRINEIGAEMKTIGIWQAKPIDPEKLNCKNAWTL
jgi:hypothetical protein